MNQESIQFEKLVAEFKEFIATPQNTLNITALGLYNGGKSSLLNALAHSYDNTRFSVADKVETKQVQTFSDHNLCYVDTPGLNAEYFDDEKALESAKHSHLNLFVHNIKTGDFVAAEKEFLELLAKNYGEKQDDFLTHTIFVLSHKDECEQDEIAEVESTLKRQIPQIFENATIEPSFISVSSKSYLKGHNENKEKLFQDSHIPALEALIKEKIAHISVAKQHKKRVDARFESIKSQIKAQIAELNEQIQSKTQQLDEMRKSIQADIQRANETLRSM